MNKKNLLACSSGGRTSMFQLEWLIENKRDEYNICGIFANTSWEHDETIDFVNKCAKKWKEKYDFDLVWVEAVVHEGRVACTHKVVTYETCKKRMEVLEDVVKKYGVPNKAYPHCTRELKENPIHDYVEKVMGWSNTKKENKNDPLYQLEGEKITYGKFEKYETALGIRIDEPRRIKYTKTTQNKVYPLVDWHPDKPDKLDILDWWEDQEFDLDIPEHLGNCVGCFKKSEKKQLKALRDAPEQFINTLEKDHGHVGPNKIKGVHVSEPRTMYRQYKTCGDIQAMLLEVDPTWLSKGDPEHMNEGCASSCEPFGGQ